MVLCMYCLALAFFILFYCVPLYDFNDNNNKNLDRSFFHFVTNHASDRQTDGRTDGQTDRNLITIPRLHYMQRGKNQPDILSTSGVHKVLSLLT